jgi:hypothetical protein
MSACRRLSRRKLCRRPRGAGRALGAAVRAAFGLLLVAWASAAPAQAAQAAPPATWAELQPALQGKDKARRAAALLRFARDETPSLPDRLRAAQGARAALAEGDPKRVEAALLEAELHGNAGVKKKRRDALAAAWSMAKRLGLEDKRARIEEARAGEEAASQLADLLMRREKSREPPPAAPLEAELAGRVEGALSSWLALGDEGQHGAARVLLGRKAALDGDAVAAVRILSDVVDALGKRRGATAVMGEASRHLARLFEGQGRFADAAAAALAADRAAAIDLKKPAPTAPALPTPYVRTAETAALCKRARAAQVSCAKVEAQRWGERTFYDFSTEPRAAFNPARADDVLAEYESLLQDCLKAGAKANLTNNTHVEIEWAIGSDGRLLKSFHLRPTRLAGTVVESCLASAFAVFRYPPYKGEMQHVRLSFDIGEVRGP